MSFSSFPIFRPRASQSAPSPLKHPYDHKRLRHSMIFPVPSTLEPYHSIEYSAADGGLASSVSTLRSSGWGKIVRTQWVRYNILYSRKALEQEDVQDGMEDSIVDMSAVNNPSQRRELMK